MCFYAYLNAQRPETLAVVTFVAVVAVLMLVRPDYRGRITRSGRGGRSQK